MLTKDEVLKFKELYEKVNKECQNYLYWYNENIEDIESIKDEEFSGGWIEEIYEDSVSFQYLNKWNDTMGISISYEELYDDLARQKILEKHLKDLEALKWLEEEKSKSLEKEEKEQLRILKEKYES